MPVRLLSVLCGIVLFVPSGLVERCGAQDARQLARWLEQYPQADADGDGVLTRDEAAAYRRMMQESRGPEEEAFESEFTFATMSDGVKIALAVGFPRGWDRNDTTRQWPAMFEMMGYPDSTIPKSPRSFGDRYVTVRASVRGAGASGGVIRAVSPITGRDGYEIIENWIVKQPWSNGKVALHGHSWGGLTGFTIAAANPPHLTAVAVSGLFDDVYRDIGRIGGIRNSGFPVHWLINLYKPTGPFDSGVAAMRARGLTQQQYEAIVESRPPWDLPRSMLWKSLVAHEYEDEYTQSSPGNFASSVRAPIHIMHAYQDEQTGPSGVWLWHKIPEDVPKRLVLSNGDHGDVGHFQAERLQWLDFWTLQEGKDDPAGFRDRSRRVQVYFETGDRTNAPLAASDFPLPQTCWVRYFLGEGQRLTTDVPTASAGGDAWRSAVGVGDQVDGVHYLLDFDQPTAICGPVTVTLWMTSTTVDTDVYAMLADVDPSGTIQMLQRGLLRASHRALDEQASLWLSVDGQRTLVRPRHTHQQPQPLEPGRPCRIDVEIFPVGHVFRPGHRLGLWLSQPPQGDPVTRHRDGRPAYQYESAQPPSTVTVWRSREYPSSILLPLQPTLPPISATPPGPGEQAGVHVKE